MFIASILVSEFIARAHCESFDVPAYAQPWLLCVGDETIIIHSLFIVVLRVGLLMYVFN